MKQIRKTGTHPKLYKQCRPIYSHMKRKNETKESKVDIPQFYESLTHDEKLELKRAVVRDYRCEIPMKGLFAYIVMIESLVFKTSYGINKHTFEGGKSYHGLNEGEWEEIMYITISGGKKGQRDIKEFLGMTSLELINS